MATSGDCTFSKIFVMEGARLPSGVVTRLRRAADEKGLKQSDIAELSGVPLGTVQKLMRGATDPQFMTMLKVVAALGQSLDYIVHGVGDESGDWETALPATAKGQIRVPIYEGRVSAGDGNVVFDGSPVDSYTFPEVWLRSLGNPKEMHLIQVNGDSMEPDLRADDHVMVDCSQREPRESLFVFNIDDLAMVKRLRLKGRGEGDLVSTNPAYGPIPVKLNDPSLIVGRVVWSGRIVR